MHEQAKISLRQLMILTIVFTVGSAVLIIPSSMASIAKQDAWIAALVGVGAGFFLLWLYNKIAMLYPQMTLIEVMEFLLGKWLGKAVALLFVVTFFILAPIAVLYFLGNFLTSQMMPETPIQAVNILFIVIIVMGVRLGLETLARAAELLFPLLFALYLLLVILVIPNIRLTNVQPVLEAGIGPIWSGALSFLSVAFLPCVSLLMIFPSSVNRPHDVRKAIYIGGLIGGMMLVLIVALTVLVLSPTTTAKSLYPSYILAQKISVGDFLQRIEAMMASIWFITLFFRIAIYLHSIVLATAQIFNLKDYRPLILPLGMIMVAMSVIVYPNDAYEKTFDSTTWISYTLTIGLFLPLLLLGIHAVRNQWSKKKKKPGSKAS